MPDNQYRPTSQHVTKEASIGGIGITTKAAKQISSSGKAAQDKRKDNKAEKAEEAQGSSSKDQGK